MGQRTVIFGAGESGVGAAILAQKEGYEVFVSDAATIKPDYKKRLNDHGIEWEEGGHTNEKIENADEIVKSPGIPNHIPLIQRLLDRKIPVISEIELAGRYTDAKIIGITGSNGKTTTTMLTYHILQNAGLNVGLAGNVGNSLALQVAESPKDYYVVELSSFQLENMYDFKVNIAVLLNITPDHLDRYHDDFNEYVDAKFRIIRNQTPDDAFIFWQDDPVVREGIEKYQPKATLYPFSETYQPESKGYVKNGTIIIESLNGIFNM